MFVPWKGALAAILPVVAFAYVGEKFMGCLLGLLVAIVISLIDVELYENKLTMAEEARKDAESRKESNSSSFEQLHPDSVNQHIFDQSAPVKRVRSQVQTVREGDA